MKKEHSNNCKSLEKNIAVGNYIPHECDCDGYHTFDELYEHRIVLFIQLCRKIAWKGEIPIWRSKLHSDGMSYDGWFILGIHKEKGGQITYHLPLEKWEETNYAETLEKAPEWDGHTSKDILERLKSI